MHCENEGNLGYFGKFVLWRLKGEKGEVSSVKKTI